MTVPILFLHGWTMRGTVFDDVAQRLGADIECVAPDLPGHGDNLDGEPSLDRCAALVRHWVDRLDRPIVVGWSMGAGAAWRYLSQCGTAGIRGLITIDMSPRMQPAKDWDLGLIGQSSEAILATAEKIEPEWERMAESISHSMYARNSDPVISREAVQDLLLAQDPAYLVPLWRDLVAMDEREMIAKIDIPYLVCTGTQSRLYSGDVAQWIESQAKHAHIESFGGSGHSPHLEEPEAFCDAIRRFVTSEGLAATGQDQEDIQ